MVFIWPDLGKGAGRQSLSLTYSSWQSCSSHFSSWCDIWLPFPLPSIYKQKHFFRTSNCSDFSRDFINENNDDFTAFVQWFSKNNAVRVKYTTWKGIYSTSLQNNCKGLILYWVFSGRSSRFSTPRVPCSLIFQYYSTSYHDAKP